MLNKAFPLTQPGTIGTVAGEKSPYGMPLGVTYPKVDIEALFAAVAKAELAWRKAGPEAWVGVSLEILTRINKRSFEIAHAVMHTTGQAFVMSFQAFVLWHRKHCETSACSMPATFIDTIWKCIM